MMAALPPCIAQQGKPMRPAIFLGTIALTALLASAGCMHELQHPAGSDQTAQPTTVDIQGAGEWKRSPHMHAYYEETVATFKDGTDIDVDAYEARSFAIFREFARANGMNEAAMIDHLKLIPRQVVGIVKENPAVLQSYDAFWAALAGPD
jgi:hypothetical protein